MFGSLPNKSGKFKMLQKEKETMGQLIEPQINHDGDRFYNQSIMSMKNFQSEADARSFLLDRLGSRGSAMLKAALNSKKPRNYTAPVFRDYPSITEDQKKAKLMKHAEELKNRRRSPKNKVLFTEPLVTSHHEYEQIVLADNEQEKQDIGDQTNEDITSEEGKLENQDREDTYEEQCIKFSNHLTAPNKPDKYFEKMTIVGTDEKKLHLNCRRGRKKRSYDVAMKNEAETCGDINFKSISNEESLFSSPKIAKIAPYYCSHIDTGKQVVSKQDSADRNLITNDKNSNTLVAASVRSQRTKVSKLLLPGEGRISKPKGAWPPEAESQETATELILVRQVPNDNQNENITPASESPKPQQSYFSWFSSGLNYLSSHMNKLIF